MGSLSKYLRGNDLRQLTDLEVLWRGMAMRLAVWALAHLGFEVKAA
jgi:hypothetical protein